MARTVSRPHAVIRTLLSQLFGPAAAREEVYLPVTLSGRKQKLFVDFVLEQMSLAIEVQGRQHTEFVPHFHGGADGFRKQKHRDGVKAEALAIAGYALLQIHESEISKLSRAALMRRINKAIKEYSKP